MNQREKIDWLGGETVMECILKMAEGNPGAATVLAHVLASPTGFLVVMKLDAENIRGHEIWMAFKDICDQDFEVFYERALRDTKALATEVKALAT